MTKVSMISGLAPTKGKVPQRRFINYGAMTDGELRLSLIAEQLNLLGELYQSDEHLANENELVGLLQSGIERGGSKVKLSGDVATMINKEINRARRFRRPAAGQMIAKRGSSKGIGDPLIDLEDCTQFMHYDAYADAQGYEPYSPTPAYYECQTRRSGIRLLNDHLEGSANHMMYEFISTSETNNRISTKATLHSNAIGALGEITSVDRDNLRLWVRNGVMRNNATHSGDAVQPEDVIATMRLKHQEGIGVAFLAILPALIAAIGSAVGATVALIGAIQQNKQQKLIQAAQSIGTPDWGPLQNDFNFDIEGNTPPGYPPPTGSTGDGLNDLFSGDTPLYLGGGLLALMLLNNSK